MDSAWATGWCRARESVSHYLAKRRENARPCVFCRLPRDSAKLGPHKCFKVVTITRVCAADEPWRGAWIGAANRGFSRERIEP